MAPASARSAPQSSSFESRSASRSDPRLALFSQLNVRPPRKALSPARRRHVMKEKISVIGLGYVGLPVALAFARKYPHTVGFDINCSRIDELKKGFDRNNETASSILNETALEFSCDPNDLATTTMFVVAVPTPVD